MMTDEGFICDNSILTWSPTKTRYEIVMGRTELILLQEAKVLHQKAINVSNIGNGVRQGWAKTLHIVLVHIKISINGIKCSNCEHQRR